MKTCSYCGHQSDDHAVSCSGCGEPFEQPQRATEAAGLKDPANAPAVIATLHSAEEAELLRAELEAAGIEAYVPEEYRGGVFSALIPFQKVTVQVPAKDAEAARAIAAAFARASVAETAESSRGAPDEGGKTDEDGAAAAGLGSNGNLPGHTRCVSCGAQIPVDSILCPKCGWTQPRLA